MSKRTRDTDSKQSIQTLFLQPCESYRLSEGARLLGISPSTLKREAAFDRCEEYRREGRWCFTWRQIACIAMQRWTLAEIQDALGSEAATALPPLLALRTVTVRLPEFIVRTLEAVATDQRITVDAALHGELIELAGTHLTRLGGTIPGYREAYFFPSQPQPQNREQRQGRPN